MRFRIPTGDVPAAQIAKLLGIAEAAFHEIKDSLYARGFPRPDPDTGNYDLDAANEWRRRRHPHLFNVPSPQAIDARTVVADRLKRMAGHG